MLLEDMKKGIADLQRKICTTVSIDDAIIEIIEIGFEDTGAAVFCPAHSHTWFELNYIISGELYTYFGDKMITFKAGNYLIVPPGVEHSHKYNSKMPHEGIFMRWQVKKSDSAVLSDSAQSICKQLNSLCFLEPKCNSDDNNLFELLVQLFEENTRTNFALNLQLLFLRFLCTLSEIHNKPDNLYLNYNQSGYSTLIRKINIMFNDVNLKKISANSIAANLHMSYGHLARIYKKLTGVTLTEKLNSVRLEKALGLLKNSDLSISEISEISGFTNQYYFSRLFKSKYSVSPSIYRKANTVSK